ncbi:MAG: metallophosphoesterase [Candidatus Obscuribacterales bacterium]|nr:metallophosphoesterase [Candidatus Obscuribacterales bacterium]
MTKNFRFLRYRAALASGLVTLTLFACLILCFRSALAEITPASFLVSPYLQAGSEPGADRVKVIWATPADGREGYRMQWRPAGKADWSDCSKVNCMPVRHSPEVFLLSSVTLENLPAGKTFEYRIQDGNRTIFQSSAVAPLVNSDNCKFAVFGDCGWGSPAQKQLAYKMYKDGIDFAVLTGDLVYQHGRTGEYLEKFFPIYNCDSASPETGAPLLRSTMFYAAPGNHDLYNGSFGVSGNFKLFADGLAYYLFWDQPLNGPALLFGEPNATPIAAHEIALAEFRSEAGTHFPRMANFSFDYGNTHWTVLDANPYVDWSSQKMATWLEEDLKKAAKCKWRFVAMHQPAFHSGNSHAHEQQMRAVAPLMEKYGVDIVFAGHVHNYQRSYPLKFKANQWQAPNFLGHKIVGEFTLDKTFDGKTNTKPNAPIYIVTGCGGAPATAERELDIPEKRESFTATYAAVYSYTRCEINKGVLLLRQLAADGRELDRIQITK